MKEGKLSMKNKEMHPDVTPNALDQHIAMKKRAKAIDHERLETIRTIQDMHFLQKQ